MEGITYTWKILHLEMIKEMGNVTNVVCRVFWVLEGVRDQDDRYSCDFGVQVLDTDSINEETFTNYENLTEQQVIGWLQTSLNNSAVDWELDGQENMVAYIKNNLATTMEEEDVYRNTGLPW